MNYPTDRVEKSKTASAVDQEHYAEQHEAQNVASDADLPSRDQIAERAFLLWQTRGCPEGSAEQDWLQAEAELQSEHKSRHIQGTAARAGSAQH